MRKYPLTKAESCGRNPFLSRSVTELPKMLGKMGNIMSAIVGGYVTFLSRISVELRQRFLLFGDAKWCPNGRKALRAWFI